MSLIRRLNQAPQHRSKKAMVVLRGSYMPVLIQNRVNTQHYEAHLYLQASRIGVPVPTIYHTKSGQGMHATYTRTGYRPNISRKWLPNEARL